MVVRKYLGISPKTFDPETLNRDSSAGAQYQLVSPHHSTSRRLNLSPCGHLVDLIYRQITDTNYTTAKIILVFDMVKK